MKIKYFFYPLLIFCVNFIQLSSSLETRAFQGCALLMKNIFCYGGYHADPHNSTNSVSVANHLVMDLRQIDFLHLNHTTPPWTNVSTPVQQNLDYVLETRSEFEIATMNDSSYMIHGGCLDPGCHTMVTNNTIQYDANTNSWTTLSPLQYTIIDGGMTSYRGMAFMWGGNFANDTTEFAPNVMFVLAPEARIPLWGYRTLGVGANIPNITRTGHSATMLEDGRIFYLGGALGTRKPTDSDKYAVMDHTIVYDTISSNWNILAINGIKIAPRKFHTATAVKGSTLVVIYGGIKSDEALDVSHNFIKETCVLLDTRTMNYSSLQFESGREFPGRYGHSAILYNAYLLLLFGINGMDRQLNYADDISVLDFTDVSHPVWLGNISDSVSQPTKTTNESTTDTPISPPIPTNTRGLSSGAIAGISVGCALAGVGFATWIFLLHQRRQKRKSEFHLQETDPRFSYNQSAGNISKVYETGLTTTTDTTSSASQGNTKGWIAGRLSLIYRQPSPQFHVSSHSYQQSPPSSPIYSLDPITSNPDILEQQEERPDLVDNDHPRIRYKPDGGPRQKPDGHDE